MRPLHSIKSVVLLMDGEQPFLASQNMMMNV